MGGSNQPAVDTFGETFEALKPLIRAEWPAVDETALADTAGDYDKVVTLVAKATEHTKTLVRRHLGELQQIAADEAKGPSAADSTLAAAQRKLQDTLRTLQAKAGELGDYVRSQALTDAKAKAEQHPLVTLLMAIGLGFIFGFVLRGLGRGRPPSA